MSVKTFHVNDYGAVGDGVTNDGFAICRAVSAALSDPGDEKEILFDGERVYRVTEIPETNVNHCLFSMRNATNISIHGRGAKLLFKGTIKLLTIENGKNFKMDGFVIDYFPKPFVIAKATGFSLEESTVDFEAEQDIHLPEEIFFPAEWWFAFPNRNDMRYHYFIKEYRSLGGLKYRIVVHENTTNRIKDIRTGDEFLLPAGEGSHFTGGACTLYDCDTFTLQNLRFYSLPEFGFDIRGNRGKLYFEGIVLKPKEDAREKLVSWRDCFHVKDNLDPIVWNHCYIGPLGDDAFNLSCVHLDVTSIEADGTEIHAFPAEKGETRDIMEGDEFVAYDLETGSEIGRGFVKKSFDSEHDVHFVSDTFLPNLKKGMQISFYKFANPGYIVKNSYIEGTVRVRSSGTFENCCFNVFWVRVENEFFVEGPIPRDITFKNCEFTTPYDSEAEVFHVGTLGKNGMTNCEYKCKNIALENCRFIKGKIMVEDGNELIIRKENE